MTKVISGAAMLTLLVGGWIAVTIMLLSADDAWPHEAGPLMPPGVQQAQVLPPMSPLPPTGKQPLGWQYPWMCCSGMDCAEISDKDVTEGPDGYIVAGATDDAPISYQDKRIKESPDGSYHWCAHRQGIGAGKTICLFAPPKGF